jgi:hypothetical protein
VLIFSCFLGWHQAQRYLQHMSSYKLLVPVLLLLVNACGSARYVFSPQGEELSGFFLMLEREPKGQVIHRWRKTDELDLTQYGPLPQKGPRAGSILLASQRPRDCDQDQIDCVQECMESRLPSRLDHIKIADGSKRRYCQKKCLDEYMDCLKSQKAHALQFITADEAVAWLKENREALFVGAIVIIAGVAFVTLTGGAGAVILVPVVLMAD